MKRKTGILIVATMALLAFLAPRSALADAISLDLTAANFGGYSGPYVNVAITLTSATTADVTFTSLTSGGYSFLLMNGSSSALNVAASSFSVGSLSATQLAGFNVVTLSVADPPGTSVVDGWGTFNLTIDSSDGYASASTSISFTITRSDGGSWASASDVITDNTDGYSAAAHVGVCTAPCTEEAGALVTGFVATPEPGAVGVFSIGLLVAGGLISRLRRSEQD